MVSVEAGAASSLDLIAVVGILLEVLAGGGSGFVNFGAHAPALASFRHKVACLDEIVEFVSLLLLSERSSGGAEGVAGFFDLLDDGLERSPFPRDVEARGDFATLCFGEAAIGAFHVVQQFADGATAVQDGVLTHATPVDLIAAIEKHFAQCILDVAHESIRLGIDGMLANGFSDDGCCASGDRWVGIRH
jgi:hypothetical protein